MNDELLREIGDLTVSFAQLEESVGAFTGTLIAEHQRVIQIITTHLSFQRLRTLAASLYLERHGKDEDYETLRRLLALAETLEKRRNQITHSMWMGAEAPAHGQRMKFTPSVTGTDVTFEPFEPGEIAKLAADMRQLSDEFSRFVFRLLETHKVIKTPFQPLWGPKASQSNPTA